MASHRSHKGSKFAVTFHVGKQHVKALRKQLKKKGKGKRKGHKKSHKKAGKRGRKSW
jgi:hypothetical protein